MSLYIFIYGFYHLAWVCNNFNGLSALVDGLILGFYKEDYFHIFKWVSFWLHSLCGKWEGWDPVNQFNHTSWVDVVTPTDRPKSDCNRCVIKVFGGVFVLSRCFLYARLETGRILVWWCPSGSPPVCPILRPSVFRNFLLHALTYSVEILHMTLCQCTTD